MSRKRLDVGPKETLKERKERASRALSSDDFLDIVNRKVGAKGIVYIGNVHAGQDAVVIVLKGGKRP